MKLPWQREKTVRVTVQELENFRAEIAQQVKLREQLALRLSDVETESGWSANQYRSYETAVTEIENKYNGSAKWGVELTGNIIDLRGSFIIANGVQIKPAEGISAAKAKNELEWARDFFAFNKLDRELTQELAKEAEIEGKIALKIAPDNAEGFKAYSQMISARFISWSSKKYTVKASEQDYMKYETLEWQPSDETKPETLDANEFVYNKFGGRLNKPNEAQPKIMKCLTQVDDISHALKDWREINRLFSAPIFDVECEDQKSAEAAKAELDDLNKKIRKGFVHAKSVLTIKGPDMRGVDSIKSEITEKIKIISGATGIPVHFLGLLDLLKNRATGDNTRELVMAGTSKEREIWKGTYKELIEKSMVMYNSVTGEDKKSSKLDPNKIDVEILFYTQEQWDRLEKVLMPLYLADAITLDFLLTQVPGLDVAAELRRRDKKDKEDLIKTKAENEALKQEVEDAQRDAEDQRAAERFS